MLSLRSDKESVLYLAISDKPEIEFRYSNGDVYKGDLLQGLAHSHGIMESKTGGYQYIGIWNKGLRQGKGVCTYVDGSVYRGLFFDDKRHGSGYMQYLNGDKYQGNWENDQRSGDGVMTLASGDVYYG